MQIVFEGMIANMFSNIWLYDKLFIRFRELNFSLFFVIQSNFAVPKNIRLNSSHLFHYENFKQTRASANCI